MIKNVRVKKILKSTIFKGITLINKFIPKKDNYILLYSGNKGISFNLLPLKNYLLKNGYGNKNKIICGIEDLKYKEDDGCLYINHFKSIYYFMRSTHVFYTAGQLPINPSKKQKVIHLLHGAPLKTIGLLTKINNGNENYFSNLIATSELYRPILSKAYNCKEKDVLINSEPVTDIFFHEYQDSDFKKFKKTILWVPTFRQSDYLGYNDSTEEEVIPMFKPSEYIELNNYLKKMNFQLIVKLHPSQKLDNYTKTEYSNLFIMSNDDFSSKGWNLYELLPQVDLLFADYSSLYLQFLLLDKPIAFIVPDFEEYSQKRGFVFSDPTEYMPGEFITTKKELYDFLDDFNSGKDKYKKQRTIVKNKIHKYADGKSCERLIKYSDIEK